MVVVVVSVPVALEGENVSVVFDVVVSPPFTVVQSLIQVLALQLAMHPGPPASVPSPDVAGNVAMPGSRTGHDGLLLPTEVYTTVYVPGVDGAQSAGTEPLLEPLDPLDEPLDPLDPLDPLELPVASAPASWENGVGDVAHAARPDAAAAETRRRALETSRTSFTCDLVVAFYCIVTVIE